MDQEAIRRHLAEDLPDYEIAPEAAADEDSLTDEAAQVEANAGSIQAWKKTPPAIRKIRKAAVGKTSVLMDRFSKREL